MSIVSISDPEILYSDRQSDELIRRILFLQDIPDDRCSMHPKSISEIYPKSYIYDTYSAITTGDQWLDGFGIGIILDDSIIDNIDSALGRTSTLLRNSSYSVSVDISRVSWVPQMSEKSDVSSIERSTGTAIEIDGRLELYLEFMYCSANMDVTCYTPSHGKTWSLRGRFISGQISTRF
jgi:hypothetical protein